ncbi:hypothetical protein DJ66_1289 [Candidatus Liberibacter solanacearum]|uniref:Uncharacterized protein n=1 Tax=Candidatus Liberibacter solanacearum TaxID=556287 RepID=A0A0F4VL01_9HYPH|nr:hypothetical protein DJ66_1289 [Candidatus Liberibacter solanacearum]
MLVAGIVVLRDSDSNKSQPLNNTDDDNSMEVNAIFFDIIRKSFYFKNK